VLARSILAFWLLLLATGPARPATIAAAINDPVSFLYTTAKSYEPLAWIRGEERFPSGANIFIRDAKGQRPLIAEFAASADPVVSFDGQRVLFAGKAHASDPWQIWEISLQGGAARRITSGSEDCIRPFYLPGDIMVYAHKTGGHFAIDSVNLAGGKPLAVTHFWGSAIPNDILHDGRILFSAAYPMGTGDAAELYTVYSDGSGVEAYRCDHGSARHSGKQTDSGDLLFVSLQRLGRFASARAQELRVSSPAGEYGGDFVETSPGEWLLSWRPQSDAAFRIVRWKLGSPSAEPVLFEHTTSLVQPVLIAPRAIPNRHPSGLHDWPNANLLCLNAYTSKYAFTPGSIRSVRVYTRDSQGAAKVLGSAPVEQDGSFFVQVPGDQPLQMELLDAAGKTLKRESGFFWMRRGEQRGCVGCHAGPETAPENAVPMVLLKSTTPFDMTAGTAQSTSGGH
jgi:hypothetical protein